jgi:hypothetical protein
MGEYLGSVSFLEVPIIWILSRLPHSAAWDWGSYWGWELGFERLKREMVLLRIGTDVEALYVERDAAITGKPFTVYFDKLLGRQHEFVM